MKRIAVDVGGTHTDAVLMDGIHLISTVKKRTTPDVTSGVVASIAALLEHTDLSLKSIQAVILGTTHFTNALIEGKGLSTVAAIRLGYPATSSLPPMVDWPLRLTQLLQAKVYLRAGGHEFDGRYISSVDRSEILRVVEDIHRNNIKSIAITSVFSPMNAECEEQVAQIISKELPHCYISLSNQIGHIGLLQRENATILNACLRQLAENMILNLEETIQDMGLHAPLFISQNDGTLMSAAYTRHYPIMTFSSGPTNSIRGAAFLSKVEDCIVVDIGGTTTDVGVLTNGFPQEVPLETDIQGVRTNFRMPDLLSIGIGGGSRVKISDNILIGPDSVGYSLTKHGLVFGGETLTATDIAVAAGYAELGDRQAVAHLDKAMVKSALSLIQASIMEAVDKIRIRKLTVPLVIVGGGSILLPEEIPGFSSTLRPENYMVANAVGASIAKISGKIDKVVNFSHESRDKLLIKYKQEAIENAIKAGADEKTAYIADVEEIPLTYLSADISRLKIKALGDLQIESVVPQCSLNNQVLS